MNDRVAAVIVRDDKMLLFWRYRNGREYYVTPGGTMEAGESEEETLLRELYEELNINGIIDRKLFSLENTGEFKRTDHYYLVTDFSGEIKLGAPELTHQHKENIYRPEWIPLKELASYDLMPEALKYKIIGITDQLIK